MASVPIGTSCMLEELLARFGFEEFVGSDFLDQFIFAVSELTLFSIVAFTSFNPVLAHLRFVFSFLWNTLRLLILLLLRLLLGLLVNPSTLGWLRFSDRSKWFKEIIWVVFVWSAGGWMLRILVKIIDIGVARIGRIWNLLVLVEVTTELLNWTALFGELLLCTVDMSGHRFRSINWRHEELVWFSEILWDIVDVIARLICVEVNALTTVRIKLHHEGSCVVCLCCCVVVLFFFEKERENTKIEVRLNLIIIFKLFLWGTQMLLWLLYIPWKCKQCG